MTKKKIPLKRSIFTGTVLFIVLLCALLSAMHLHSHRQVLYSQCERRVEDILRYVEADIDVDDLAECMRTGEESEKYHALQRLLDQFRDRLDIHFIYIVEPLNAEATDNLKNVIAGASQYEYENEAEELVHLNTLTGDSYSPKTAAKYLNAYQSDKLSFFEKISEWGDDYTGLLPLHDSRGNRAAALCVDVDVAQIHTTLRGEILRDIAMIVLLGVGFILLFVLWMGQNVTKPIEQLERSVVDFASNCRNQKDPEALKIDVPTIRANNEVAGLAGAVSEMSEAMQDYVKSVAMAESAARTAQTIAELKDSIGALFANMPGMNFSKDAETGVYLACNQAFADYAHKSSPAGVVGLRDEEIFDAATAKHFVEDDRKALSMDEPYIFYEDVPDAAGNPRQFQTTKLKFTDFNGRLCVLGMCADVSDTRAQIQANSMITALSSDYRAVYHVNLDENDGVCYRDDPEDAEQTPRGVHFPYLERFTWYAEHCVAEMYREGFLDFIDPDNIRKSLAKQPIIAYRYLARRDNREYYEMIRAAGVRRAEERDDHMVHAVGIGMTKIDAEMRETMAKNEALAEALTLAEEASKANQHGGSGLGLAMAKKLVDLMNGEISVQSEKGKGSTFEISVRLERANDRQAPGSAAHADVELAGRHILVAEDMDLNAEMIADLLELEGMTSERAENGQKAVERFSKSSEGHFDAILMDMRMPVMDGLSATKEIRTLNRGDARTVPIIALTANASEEEIRQSLQAGMDMHLSKPVDPDLLYDTLKRLLAGRWSVLTNRNYFSEKEAP